MTTQTTGTDSVPYNPTMAEDQRNTELDPNDADAYYNRGLSYRDMRQYRRAIEDFDKAVELDPNFAADVYRNRGFSYSGLGQHERAIEDFDKVVELAPNNARAYNNRGFSYSELGQHERAIEDYDTAIELDPNEA
jgi:tetratricopeptide (TPR) repeat protein